MGISLGTPDENQGYSGTFSATMISRHLIDSMGDVAETMGVKKTPFAALGTSGSVSRLNFRLGPLSFRHCGGVTGALPRVVSRRILMGNTATNLSTAVFHGRPKWL